jgi:hypothetical protein
MDDLAFSQYVFSGIVEWVKRCLANPSPGVVPDAVWFLFRALACARFEGFFEGFCGDLQALAADLERPDDDFEWFCDECPPSFLRDFLVPLAFCPDASVIPPVFFHFLARCTEESDSSFPFAAKQFLDCLAWDTCPAAAVTMAGFFLDRECPGWEEYLEDGTLAALTRFLLDAVAFATREMILAFLQKLIAVSQSHDMPAHLFLGVVHFVY